MSGSTETSPSSCPRPRLFRLTNGPAVGRAGSPRDSGTPRDAEELPADGPPGQRRAERRRAILSWTRVTLLFTVVAVVTHLPGFTRLFWNPDEGFLTTEARVVDAGGGLYTQVVDRKPPLLPYLYAGAVKVSGVDAIWLVRGLAVVAYVAIAVMLSMLARRRFGRFGVAAGLLYLCASVGLAPADAQAASFEVFMLPWTVAAMLLADRARWTGSGLACAIATLTKQTAGATLLPVLWRAWRGRRLRGVAVVLLSFLIPVLGTAVAFGWNRFLFWVFTGSSEYLTPDGTKLGEILGRAFGNLGIVALANGGLLVAIGYGLYRERVNRADTDLWLWLAGSVVGVTSGFHFFGHYYLQLLPPLVLLATGALARHHRPRRAFGLTWRPRRHVLGYAAVSVAGFLTFAFVSPPQQESHAESVALVIRHETRPSQRILVWGMNPEIYYMADRKPATRFLTAGFLTNFAGGASAAQVGEQYAVKGAWSEFLLDLYQHPAALIVDDSGDEPYSPHDVPLFGDVLATDYYRAGTAAGDPIYRRRPAFAPATRCATPEPPVLLGALSASSGSGTPCVT